MSGIGRGSETFLGATLGSRRKKLILATKFGFGHDGRVKGGSRLCDVGRGRQPEPSSRPDWIDVYYYHRPDPATPIEETRDALDDLVRQGKIRFPACSNMPGAQLAAAMDLARIKKIAPFVAAQDHYNLLSRDIEATLVPVIARYGIALVPYFPLARGFLTGKYRKGQPMPPLALNISIVSNFAHTAGTGSASINRASRRNAPAVRPDPGPHPPPTPHPGPGSHQ
jgi:aryl-alcohol dehydrogenase-like predicted oxidoreductase